MRRAVKYGTGVLGGIAGLLLAGGVFLTATGPGQRTLLGLAGWALSSEVMTVETGELTGSLFGQGQISRITVSDTDGLLADVEQIRFGWSPSDLLDGRISIETLHVKRVDLRRLPSARDSEADTPGDTAPGVPPLSAGKTLLPPLTIERLDIAEAVLSESVLGAPARLSVSGQIRAGTPEEAIAASFTVRDMDRPNFAKAHAEYRADRGTLQIAASAEEQAGGILTTLLDFDDARNLKLELNGDGPLDRWRGDWQLTINSTRAAGGKLTLSGAEDGLSVAIDADGEIGRFLPGHYASLLNGSSQFNLAADYLGKEKIRLRSLKLDAPSLRIRAAGTADLTRHAIAGKGRIELGEGDDDGAPVSIILDEETNLSVQNAEIILNAVPGKNGIELKAVLDAKGLAARRNSLASLSIEATAIQPSEVGAFFEDLDALEISAQAQQPRLANPAYVPLVGEAATINLSGRKDASELTIADMTANGAGGSIILAGILDAAGFEGKMHIDIPDSDVFGKLAGRELGGSLSVSASGRASSSGQFDLALDSAGQNIVAGDDAFGRLFEDSVILKGRLAHDGQGFRFDRVSLVSKNLHVAADGSLSAWQSDLKTSWTIPDLSAILPDSSGAVQINAALEGEGTEQTLAIAMNAPEGEIHGLPVTGLSISYDGRGNFAQQTGLFNASGQIGSSVLKGRGQINLGQTDGHSIRNFELALGSNRLTANVVLPADGNAEGRAYLDLTDTSLLSEVLGMTMGGAAEVEAHVWMPRFMQVVFEHHAHVIRCSQLSGNAASPHMRVKANAEDFTFGPVQIASLNAAMVTDNAFEHPVYSGHGVIGSVKVNGKTYGPLRIESVAEGNLSAMTIDAGIGNETHLSAKTRIALPDWQPDISLSDLVLKHPRAELRQRGAARLRKAEQGYMLDGLVLQIGKGQLSASAALGDQLDGRISLSAMPLKIAGMFAPDIAPQGTIDGEISLGGTTDEAIADYKLFFRDVSEPGLLPPGFPKLDASAAGGFADKTLTINAKAIGADGISFGMTGVMHGLGETNALELKSKGTIPMRLANSFLALRGTQIEGSAHVDLAVSGRADAPVITGTLTATNATLNDPPTGISLTNMDLGAKLDGKKFHITKLTARSANSGTVEASGTLGVSVPKKLPASIKLSANNLQFNDRRIVAGQASGAIDLEGDLLGTSKLSGRIDIARLDVRIPKALPASVSALDLKHKNAPAHITVLEREPEKTARNKSSASVKLALDVRSANRIFVTGRGLDAQLGGQMRLSGSAGHPQAIGQFTLERGRLAVLGRSLDITSGTLDFSGDLDPRLNFTAVTEADDTRITIAVTGSASSPQFTFSSEPELPEDEILALLLFNKSLAQLTPSQLVQLASQVSELGGLTGGPGVLDKLKTGLGIDRLDVTTTEDGEVAVTAGSYVNENLYVGVEKGSSDDSSRVKVDLDITKNIKLSGESGADGQSKIGLGVEWEY